MPQEILLAAVLGCVSLLYATAGQAGGTAFLAVMAFAGFAASEMRPTALFLNIVAAGYATWRLHRRGAIDLRLLLPLTVPSLATSFLGGLLVLEGPLYFALTGAVLVAAAALMVWGRRIPAAEARPITPLPAALVGGGAGLLSGVTGVGGGVFLTPTLVALGWTTAKQAALLSPPFILCNSILGLAGVLLAGQSVAPGVGLYAAGALGGAALGTMVGHGRMSEAMTRRVLALILLFAGIRLLLR